MKAVLAIAVFACFLVAASARLDCATRVNSLGSCIARVAQTHGSDNVLSYCRECGNSLVSYFHDCTNGVGVDDVKASKSKACGAMIVQCHSVKLDTYY